MSVRVCGGWDAFVRACVRSFVRTCVYVLFENYRLYFFIIVDHYGKMKVLTKY